MGAEGAQTVAPAELPGALLLRHERVDVRQVLDDLALRVAANVRGDELLAVHDAHRGVVRQERQRLAGEVCGME